MKTYIITGTSSGIGKALAVEILKSGDFVISVSRAENKELTDLSQATGNHLKHYSFDLEKPDLLHELITNIFSFITDEMTTEGIALVNNAGTLDPVGFSGYLTPAGIETHFKINLLTPAILVNEFIRITKSLNIKKTIVNVSSGAANHPYAGWSNYCASKSGLDMLTKCIAAEQAEEEFPTRIISLAPGIVETKMQQKIRSVSSEQFPMQHKFIELHKNQQLSSPQEVAARVIPLVFSDQPTSGTINDLRKL